MPDTIRELYSTRDYPAMSHPSSDPAVCATAALLGGLAVPPPSAARFLEIGSSSGHNLIPLAMRWPHGRFTGIDLSDRAIGLARDLVSAAHAENIGFHVADLRDFKPSDRPWDYIIAHGFFSWVPDDVKSALFTFCRENLSPAGIATISFNLECGWLPRFPVIEKVHAIQGAGAADEMTALAVLRSVTPPESPELAVIDDMLAKGPDILPFDDFAPINDPWPLDRFIRVAAAAGLRCLGESDPGQNVPQYLDAPILENLRNRAGDPLSFLIAADAAAQRTFRTLVLCRDDAPVEKRNPLECVTFMSVRKSPEARSIGNLGPLRGLDSNHHASVPVEGLLEQAGRDRPEALRRIFEGIQEGWILSRIEPLSFDPAPPAFPKLDTFRAECARRRLPLVDVWHRPCMFPPRHYEILAAMDGSRSLAELAAFSAGHSPELAFGPWLRHLAGRGMFT